MFIKQMFNISSENYIPTNISSVYLDWRLEKSLHLNRLIFYTNYLWNIITLFLNCLIFFRNNIVI